ncbi:hypothetical protein GCM10025794_00780 [Massilia kyonggiensis]|nr:hypothetical protein [Massilia kyonggiensis]
MANYINQTILSESYAHIDVVELSPTDKHNFEVEIKAYQAPRARRMLGVDIEPVVRTEDGSLKVYLTVYGSLSNALGDFSDFREALQLLYTSSKMVAEACNLESLFLANASKKQLIRSEARTGVVKATKDLYDQLYYLNETSDRFSHKNLNAMADDLSKKTTQLNKNLTEPQDRQLVWANLLPMYKRLPTVAHKLQLNPDDSFTKSMKGIFEEMLDNVKKFEKEAAKFINA